MPCNTIKVKDPELIPNQVLIVRTLRRAKYCSTIDRVNWYFQIRVEPKCERYNKIKTPFKSFAYKVML
jgi:hypothetical protein